MLLLFTISGIRSGQAQSKLLLSKKTEYGKLLYVQPLKLNPEGAAIISADFTIAWYETENRSTQVMNFSIIQKDEAAEIENVSIEMNGKIFSPDSLKRFFVKKEGAKWISRYSAEYSTEVIPSLFENAEQTQFIFGMNGQTVQAAFRHKNTDDLADVYSIIRLETGR